jgi:hypothetical protein
VSQYDTLSEEEIARLIRELQEAHRRKRGQPTRSQLAEMLSPSSPNFMGTGMTAQEFMMSGEIQYLMAAYWRQSRKEKNRRRAASIRLALELGEIRKKTNFATIFAEEAVADVINGDWKDLKQVRDYYLFEDEEQALRESAVQIYARFVQLIDEVLASVPKDEPEASPVAAPN